ncbi:hypothetical protein TMatcc_004187 [Talaromyces marneffei ATCC 18224]
MPTFLPGPAPLRTRGEKTVIPAQSIGAVDLGPFGAICVHNNVGAVGLVVVLALLAVAAGEDLGANTDSLAYLDVCDLGSDFDYRANDF